MHYSIKSFLLAIATLLLNSHLECAEKDYFGEDFYRDINYRAEKVINLELPPGLAVSHPKFRSYDSLAKAEKSGCSDSDVRNEILGLFASSERDKPSLANVDIFVMVPVARYLHQYAHCLTHDDLDLISSAVREKSNLFEHGTVNHAIMRMSSIYLFAQFFPDISWVDNSGKKFTSAELMSVLKSRLKSRVRGIYAQGHTEWLSPTYAMINFISLLNLYDFSKDQEVKQLADSELTLQLSVLFLDSFKGSIVPPITRRIYDQINVGGALNVVSPSVSQHLLWLYFGEPRNLGFNDLMSRREPNYLIIPAVSKWRPSQKIFDLVKSKNAYRIRIKTPHFSYWGESATNEISGEAYIGKRYAIGSGGVHFFPSAYNHHIQTFGILFASDLPRNQIECRHQYWLGNKGENEWGADGWSPFVQTKLIGINSAVLIANIPESDPWVFDGNNRFFSLRDSRKNNLVKNYSCRFPQQFDQFVVKKNWIYFRYGAVKIGISILGHDDIADSSIIRDDSSYKILTVLEPKSAMYFLIDEDESVDLNGFINRSANVKLSYNKENSSVDIFYGAKKEKLNVKFKLVAINDREWDSSAAIEPSQAFFDDKNDYVIDSNCFRFGQNGFDHFGCAREVKF